jgi:hypothetical protein
MLMPPLRPDGESSPTQTVARGLDRVNGNSVTPKDQWEQR